MTREGQNTRAPWSGSSLCAPALCTALQIWSESLRGLAKLADNIAEQVRDFPPFPAVAAAIGLIGVTMYIGRTYGGTS